MPVRVTLATGLFVAGLLFAYAALPVLPIWAWALIIVAMHRFQQYSHSAYRMHHDMSEFESDYPKGPGRFVLLLVYELPILLNYLCIGKSDWVFRGKPVSDSDMANVAAPSVTVE